MQENRIPLGEYPRPQMRRESYYSLNGTWEFEITKTPELPQRFSQTILVPFSPETASSGVLKTVSPKDYAWYRRSFSLPEGFRKGRVLLHFDAADQIAEVFFNGVRLGSHTGGYTPFSFEITDVLKEENVLTVKIVDLSDTSYHSRGKQKIRRGGIWYTPQSGLWQSVWLECVPLDYIETLRITPLYDESAVELTVRTNKPGICRAKIGETEASFAANEPFRFALPGFTAWSPENPYLYSLEVTFGEDRVDSYFGMRKFSVEPDSAGVKRLFLNGKPYFHCGVLDQGYYPGGMYTPLSDEAMIRDIESAKKLGFNMIRKHIKIEPLRWYYHCDRLGMLVWQDMPNGGGSYSFFTVSAPLVTGIHLKDHHYRLFSRKDPEGREQYRKELSEMIDRLYNCTCIAVWVPFNEGWGQFDAEEAVKQIRSLDRSRTIDHASGWHDQKIGELQSMHVYFKKFRLPKDRLGRAQALSEFGGYNFRISGHGEGKKNFGYRKIETQEEFAEALDRLIAEQILPAQEKGLSACVYTQLSDVEDELNGLLTFDRAQFKVSPEESPFFRLLKRNAR